jgi:hypothetical protein
MLSKRRSEFFMSSSTTSVPAPAASAPKVGDVVTSLKADIKGEVLSMITREQTFFESHPKAIAIGAGVAGLIAGFGVHAFL